MSNDHLNPTMREALKWFAPPEVQTNINCLNCSSYCDHHCATHDITVDPENENVCRYFRGWENGGE